MKKLLIVIDSAGGKSALARKLKIAPANITAWLTGRRKIPIERAKQIEKMGLGATREELRPDIFGRK
jgi:DNA-binding transcriptional regulator YdaS (Cro superfamily)